MRKLVTYQDTNYMIVYTYTQSLSITTKSTHKLHIEYLNTNNRLMYLVTPPSIVWTDDSSIIKKTKDLLDDFISKEYKSKTLKEEFIDWNGNLNNWDE